MAHRAALRSSEVARQLSLAVAVFTCAAVLATTAGRSYADAFCDKEEDRCLEDTVVVSNSGALLGGSVETFAFGTHGNHKPALEIKGANTGLGNSGAAPGVAGLSVDPFDGHIVVTAQLENFVARFSNGANGNSAPDGVIVGPDTGLDTPDGVDHGFTYLRYGNGVAAASGYSVDVIAVANFLPAIIEPGDFGFGICTAIGFSLGSVTEYFPDDTGDASPVNESFFNFGTGITTLGGCATFMLGPVGVAFDYYGDLFVVQNAGGYVTVFEPGAFGNEFPIAVFGTGFLISPTYIALGEGGGEAYVTDIGDNSVKFFFFDGEDWEFDGAISGRHTKLKTPQGIASSGDDLYVVNNTNNSLIMFDDIDGLGDVRPTAIVQGLKTNLHQPVGLDVNFGGVALNHK